MALNMAVVTTLTLSGESNRSPRKPQSPREDCSRYANGVKMHLLQDDKAVALKGNKNQLHLVKVTARHRNNIEFTITLVHGNLVELRASNNKLVAMNVDGELYLRDKHKETETKWRVEHHRKGKKLALKSAGHPFYLGVGGLLGMGNTLSGHRECGHGELFVERLIDAEDMIAPGAGEKEEDTNDMPEAEEQGEEGLTIALLEKHTLQSAD